MPDPSSHRSASRKRPKTVFSATLLCRLQLRFTTLFSYLATLERLRLHFITTFSFVFWRRQGTTQVLAGTLRVETISRLSGSLLTSKLISAYTQGRIARNTELIHAGGFLESVKDARFSLIINKKITASLSKDGAKVLLNQPFLLTKC